MRLPIFLALLAPTQKPPSLAEYLKAHPVAGALAVSAEDRTPVSKAAGLEGYGRKAVRLGGVTAIVPVNMVEFDDSLREPPNLYDGLSRGTKVLYLLTTLTSGQWDKATRDGIGLGDLHGEQAKVFGSILPKSLKWTKQRLESSGAWGKEVAKGEMDADAIKGLRIRVERSLQLELPIEKEPRSYTFHGADEERGEPGTVALFRDDEGDFDRGDSFGVQIRKTVPNAPKKGQLDTKALGATVVIPAQTTVGAALEAVGRASGREILADLRVRDRKVSFNGGRARAGDLLDALALAVEGTYRRVGDTYLLAADVTGLGARKLRLSIWEEDLRYGVRQKEAEWRRAIQANGGLAKAGYDEAGGLAPNAEMLRQMQGRKPGNDWDSTATFTPAIRAFIDRVNVRYSSQKVATDRARAKWRLAYRFVTAEGEAFGLERDGLASDFEFDPVRAVPERPRAPFERPNLAPEKGAGLALAARTPEEAASAVALAKRYGFAELWLRTTDPATLTAALGTGFPVRLLVQPWVADPGTRPDALDRSILGDTASQAVSRVRASETAVKPPLGAPRTGWERAPLELDPTDVLAAIPPARRAALLALANAPGLKGVILTHLRPPGYEGPGDGSMGAERQELLAASKLGYSEAARLAFLRKRGIDPIDLSDRNVRFGADLRPPFFLDDNLRASSSVYDGTQSPIPEMEKMGALWATDLAEANARAVASLFAGLSAPSVLVEMPRPPHTSGGEGATTLVPWSKGTPSPTAFTMEGIDPKSVRGLFVPPAGEDARRLQNFQGMLGYLNKTPTFAGAFDLTAVPPAKWDAALGAWFMRR